MNIIEHFAPENSFLITFGFFDSQTKYFQSNIPRDILTCISNTFQNDPLVIFNTPLVESYGNSFHYTLENTMWDVEVQQVHTRQHAIFISNHRIQIIVEGRHLQNVLPFFQTIVQRHSETFPLFVDSSICASLVSFRELY